MKFRVLLGVLCFVLPSVSYANGEVESCIKHVFLYKTIVYSTDEHRNNADCMNLIASYDQKHYSSSLSKLISVTRSELIVYDENIKFGAILEMERESDSFMRSYFCLPQTFIDNAKIVFTYSTEEGEYVCSKEFQIRGVLAE